jgi:hypothetical protein
MYTSFHIVMKFGMHIDLVDKHILVIFLIFAK